jgi:4-methyl-5(b-hydroxyethyl)-thiazole monophosphate biosynthesis
MLLKGQAAAGRYNAAICAAPKVLAAAGLLDGKEATGYPGALDPKNFPRVRITGRSVVRDGKIVTSRGPGTAMDFALELIEILAGPEKREAVEKPLMRPTAAADADVPRWG